jgi:hypothetical protein
MRSQIVADAFVTSPIALQSLRGVFLAAHAPAALIELTQFVTAPVVDAWTTSP